MTEYIKCETCLYNKNCQFLAKHRNTIVEGCSAYKNAADVVEVVHGEWIKYKAVHYKCSICGNRVGGIITKYCSECGAKMDGDANATH